MKNQSKNKDWRSESEKFISAGLRTIPFWASAEGAAGFPSSWGQYSTCETKKLVSDDFWRKYGNGATGLAMIMGKGMEAIDVDIKADPTGKINYEYLEAVQNLGGASAIEKCAVIKTKSGGMHFVYLADNAEGNQKLASRPKKVGELVKPETLVETRGLGGLLFVSPTTGYTIQSGHYFALQKLTNEERNILIQAGRTCDRMPESDPELKREIRQATKAIPKGEGVTPWDAFNESMDAQDMMESLGWTVVSRSGKYIRMNRPGHKNSQQASGSVIADANVFYPFTTSTEFESLRGYTPFAIYATTAHAGDFSEAAKQLYKDGYGDRRGKEQRLDGSSESLQAAVDKVVGKKNPTPLDAADELTQLLNEVDKEHTFDINKAVEDPKFVMFYFDHLSNKEIGVSALQMFGLFVGLQKSGKTTLLRALIVAALTNGTYLNFRFDIGDREIIWIDCEQPKYWFQLLCKGIYRQAGLKNNSPRFRAVSLRRYSKAQRAAITGALFLRAKNLGIGIIDGLVDVCQNFNDVEHSESTIDKVLEWSDRSGALILGVIHLTKGHGFIKGHLGTISQNKCDFAFESRKKEDGTFEVTHREARGRSIPDFSFSRDENGDPVLPEDEQTIQANPIQKTKPSYPAGQQLATPQTGETIPF